MKKKIFFFLTILYCTGIALAVEPNPGSRFSEKISGTTAPEILHFTGVSIWFPDDWQVSNTSSKLVTLSRDNTACVLMKPIDLNAIDPNLSDFESFGDKLVTEFKATQKLALLKPIKLPLTFWASKDVPFDWKKLAATTDVPFDWKSIALSVVSSDIRQFEQSGLKLISIEGVGKLSGTEHWTNITLIGLPNGRVLLLFAVSGMDQKSLEANRELTGKILRSLQPE